MITQCGHCGTKFEISTELVESDDPRVRCGECLEVFNAKVQLVREESFSEPAIPTVTQRVNSAPAQQLPERRQSPAVELESYISADDLENAATLALDVPVDTGSADNTRRESPVTAPHPTINDEFYSPDLQINPSLTSQNYASVDELDSEFEKTLALDTEDETTEQDFHVKTPILEPGNDTEAAVRALDDTFESSSEQMSASIPVDDYELATEHARSSSSDTQMYDNDSALELRRHISRRGGQVLPIETEQTRRRVKQKSMLLPLASIALLLAATLYIARDRVAALDLPAPLLMSFCDLVGCQLPVKQDLTQLELLQHRMNIHSRREDVLVINVDMVNNAPFRQPYPILAVTMSDKDGGIVAERKFEAADYLDPSMLAETLPPKEPVRIRFEILDPGPEAVASELEFE